MLRTQSPLGAFHFNTQHPAVIYSDDVRRALFSKWPIVFSKASADRVIRPRALIFPGFALLLQVQPGEDFLLNVFL